MKPRVTVIDYGLGNLYSVGRAFEVCGAEVILASTAEQIRAAHHLILPGVGAFAAGMAGLRERQLIEPIRAHAAAGKPLMGICLGMQMFASVSEEFGVHEGLNIIPGKVCRLPQTTVESKTHKIPRVGWASLYKAPKSDWEQTALSRLHDGDSVYLVHSYAMQTNDLEHQLAVSQFGGHPVCTVVKRGATIGCQFHPEKSGPVGLKVLSGFLDQ